MSRVQKRQGNCRKRQETTKPDGERLRLAFDNCSLWLAWARIPASLIRDAPMKTILLALALFATGVHAAQNPDATPCDGVDEDKQTLECSVYGRDTAVKLLDENFQNLLERVKVQFGANKGQSDEFTAKLKAAAEAWKKLRDADCAVEVFPATPGSKDYNISMNDCLAHTSDERSEYLESIAQSE
jgi:uncharacterized protein YecT (DUF1311 family)